MKLTRIAVLGWMTLALLCKPAVAHLLSAGYGSLHLQGDQARLLIGVPVSLFKGVDLNQDGLLQPIEIREGRASMLAQLQAAVDVRWAHEPSSGPSDFESQIIDDHVRVSEHIDVQKSTRQIEWLRIWRVTPTDAASPLTVHIHPQALSTDYLLQVRHNVETETAMLSSSQPSHTFFKGAWDTLAAFTAQGVWHILTGLDHILFLAMMLITSVVLKRWLIMLTAFTLAHGTTYALATYGVLYVRPELIEPVIAYTIVLVAAAHLLHWRPPLTLEASVIFSLGLFHGLGFASAMSPLSRDLRFPVPSVLGFNLGIELGQIALAMLLWVGLAAVGLWRSRQPEPVGPRRGVSAPLRDPHHLLARGIAWVSLVVGTYWLIERVLF